MAPAAAPAWPGKRLWHFRAQRVILATGAHERPIVFGNNDLPGIVLANAACTYATRYGVSLGANGVAFVNNDHGFALALETNAVARNVSTIVDVRAQIDAGLERRATEAGVRVIRGSVIACAHGTKRVSSVDIRPARGSGLARIECDHVLVSGGVSPAVHLYSQATGALRYDTNLACFLPDACRQAVEVAGALNGRIGLDSALADGAAAGARTLSALGRPAPAQASPPIDDLHVQPLWSVQSLLGLSLPGKHFVDYQNDVTEADIRLAAREGFRSVEHAKRYTTTGMATDQGKTSNVIGLAILADALGKTIPEVGTTTFRPPFTPVTLGAIAGRDRGTLSDPVRTTPMHAWHVDNGAVFEDVGQWKRPWYFPRPGEDMHAAVARETKALRTTAGVMDATTLGKIDIQGADAAEFLNRVYTNAWTKLAVGSCRYGVMCRPDGMVMDDGVTARLGRRPLPDDDHHGQRRARARLAGGMAADRMAGTQGLLHHGHRTMGDHRGGRAQRAQDPAGPRAGHGLVQCRLSFHDLPRRPRRRDRGARVPHQLQRRACPTRSTSRPGTAWRSGKQ